jgi:ABC-type bacteriocin/lantibiotic exporter with double-glycine peptidase domain
MDENQEGKRINMQEVVGNIEFKNVWFRYPTRKEEWVLRGLKLKV